MTRPRLIAATLLSAIALAGCDWLGGASSSNETEMRNVEIQPGTVSDEMITLDAASGDGTAIDTSSALGPAVSADSLDEAAEDNGEGSTDAPVASDASEPETQPGDVVIRPPGGRAEGDAPAKK